MLFARKDEKTFLVINVSSSKEGEKIAAHHLLELIKPLINGKGGGNQLIAEASGDKVINKEAVQKIIKANIE